MTKSDDYQRVLTEWDGGEPTLRLYRALGQIALGQLAGSLVGWMLFEIVGKRVYQLLEIAVNEGALRSKGDTR